jgi:hypothetical protein
MAGAYDDECTAARESARAHGAILIVFHGDRGCGFSSQVCRHVIDEVPRVLREIADKMERDLAASRVAAGLAGEDLGDGEGGGLVC